MSVEPISSLTVPLLPSDLPQRLAARLLEPLPGREAQRQFEPELSFGRHLGPAPFDARPATVLALLYPHEGQWFLPLTIRPATLSHHAGQISFPGGGIDPGERSEHAALRELQEELGVGRSGVELLGQLSPLYLFGTNFVLHPWVAAINRRPDFEPSPAEVAELLETPLLQIMGRQNWATHARRNRGVAVTVPHIAWGRHRIWGATSMILGELVSAIESASPSVGGTP